MLALSNLGDTGPGSDRQVVTTPGGADAETASTFLLRSKLTLFLYILRLSQARSHVSTSGKRYLKPMSSGFGANVQILGRTDRQF